MGIDEPSSELLLTGPEDVPRVRLRSVETEIAIAAIAGTAFYGAVALAERATTFWHPSYRT